MSTGEIRSAEPDASAHSGWRVNEWVKRGILLAFRFGDTVDMTVDHGRWPFFDKVPAAQGLAGAGVRVVSGGSSIRDGAYLGKGVICMPPMYINIGAYVGDESLIDSHALVGSCAQVGRRVHVSAAAQIGGVLEPVGALPVIVEDDVLIGGNCGVYEGAVIKRRAVLASGTILTASTPIYDITSCHHQGGPGRAARGSRRRRGCPGIASDPIRAWEGLALGRHPDHREIPRREDERENSTGRMDTVAALAFARALIDIDSTTGEEAAAGAWLASALRDLGYQVVEQPVEGDRFNVLAAIDKPEVVLSTHFDCVPPFFPSSIRDGNLCGRGACDAKGFSRAGRSGRTAARGGQYRVGLLFVVGEERGSDGAAAANRSAPGSRFLVNGEPTSSQVATGTRGILRLRLRASGRAGHSSAPEHFESAIEKLIDALVGLRRLPIPCNDIFGATSYSIGLIEGGVAPNVVPASASAEVMFRTVGDADEVLQAVRPWSPCPCRRSIAECPVQLTTVPGIPPRAFRLRRISPYSTAGARHSSMVLAPSSSRIPTTSTWPWPSSRRASTATSRSSGRCYRAGEGLGRVTTVRGRRSCHAVESDGRT